MSNNENLTPEQLRRQIYKRERQKFSEFEKDYILDNEKKCLVETGKTNVQEKIQSHADCALDKVLDTFLDPRFNGQVPVFSTDFLNVVDAPVLQSKLDAQLEAYAYFESLKQKYGLDPTLTYKEVISKLNGSNDKMKEVLKNAKTQNVQKGEQEKLQKNGNEDSSKES